jgi:hypothetical protein
MAQYLVATAESLSPIPFYDRIMIARAALVTCFHSSFTSIMSDLKTVEKGYQLSLGVHVESIDDAVNPIYQAKAPVLNDALQDVGMGRYQWGLFVVTGFGWLA